MVITILIVNFQKGYSGPEISATLAGTRIGRLRVSDSCHCELAHWKPAN